MQNFNNVKKRLTTGYRVISYLWTVGFSEAAVSRIAKTPGCSEISDLRFAWGCKRIRLSEPCALCRSSYATPSCSP